MKVASLFAGVGGIELGLEWAGMQTVAQVELDPFCRQVLARHWPEVPQHDDARTAVPWWLEQGLTADVVCGGFPCQPFSLSGRKLGTADARWGWPWFADAIRTIRPSYVVVENVAALLRYPDAFGTVLGDLAELGFDAEWRVFTACEFGAPHTRRRLFLVAYPNGGHGFQWLADSAWGESGDQGQAGQGALQTGYGSARAWSDRVNGSVAPTGRDDRGTDGLPARMVRAGGNAVVPAITYYIGRSIMQHREESNR